MKPASFSSKLFILLLFILNIPKPLHSEQGAINIVSNKNSTVTFEVDSTWHLVHGTVKDLEGTISIIKEPTEKITAAIKIPVNELDTENGSRDKKMRKVMHGEPFPFITVNLLGTTEQCLLSRMNIGEHCEVSFTGTLEISGTKREVTIPTTISRLNDSEVSGTGILHIAWKDYGIEDPSIFIATVYPDVTITFSSKVPYAHSS